MVRLQALRGEFDLLKMKESESVEEFYNRTISVANQLLINGEEISDKRIIEKILRSMTRKFEHVIVAIEESKDLNTFSLEELLGSLQSHELRIKQFDSSPFEQVFQIRDTNRGGLEEEVEDQPVVEDKEEAKFKVKIQAHLKEEEEEVVEDTVEEEDVTLIIFNVIIVINMGTCKRIVLKELMMKKIILIFYMRIWRHKMKVCFLL